MRRLRVSTGRTKSLRMLILLKIPVRIWIKRMALREEKGLVSTFVTERLREATGRCLSIWRLNAESCSRN
jgi:hypothetical protein